MNVLFATDRGDLMGREPYEKVEEYARKIDKLERNLRRQGIKPSESKRYRGLQERLRALQTKNHSDRELEEEYGIEVVEAPRLQFSELCGMWVCGQGEQEDKG